MEVFRKVLEDCNLVDVGFTGNWFTWEIGNLPSTNIQERLDRRVATEEWLALFPEFQLQHLPHTFSDHCPLLINTKKRDVGSTSRSLKFEAWWVLEESFLTVVKNIWANATDDLLSKLESVKRDLERWARQIQYNRKEKEKMLTSKLSKLMEVERNDENLADIIDTRIQLNFEIDKDERYWDQGHESIG
ncbi:uncharacterized protein LOC108477569 [Gossypium arboreum]|uniref:uncharacterized protein LOC108477569 n=1 Tax=Gossypium arboreum TaxID=29729 RepID=UPI0008191773|nr:uncharacterized protein LOC108477569 [Gossypium arboreum]